MSITKTNSEPALSRKTGSDSFVQWRELEVGDKVRKGDVGRWPDGDEIEVPSVFWGKEITKPGIYFRPIVPNTKTCHGPEAKP